jgi:hypothetical protein
MNLGLIFIPPNAESYRQHMLRRRRRGVIFAVYIKEILKPINRPNGGSNLTYTPQDTPNDWLLAFGHFAATHEVVEIVYEAAIRTLSDDHPVLAILNRSKFLDLAPRDVLTFQSALELLRIAL